MDTVIAGDRRDVGHDTGKVGFNAPSAVVFDLAVRLHIGQIALHCGLGYPRTRGNVAHGRGLMMVKIIFIDERPDFRKAFCVQCFHRHLFLYSGTIVPHIIIASPAQLVKRKKKRFLTYLLSAHKQENYIALPCQRGIRGGIPSQANVPKNRWEASGCSFHGAHTRILFKGTPLIPRGRCQFCNQILGLLTSCFFYERQVFARKIILYFLL